MAAFFARGPREDGAALPWWTSTYSRKTRGSVVLSFQCSGTVPGLIRSESRALSVNGASPWFWTPIVPFRIRLAGVVSQGAAVPHYRPRHRPVHAHGAAAGERLCDNRPARLRPASLRVSQD